MTNTLLNQKTVNIAFVIIAILVAAFTAEASPQSENLSAGFKGKIAKTVSQRQELEMLAKGSP
jgi:hypothetical protein